MKQTEALNDVVEERDRQQAKEGWTLDHDDEHADGKLALLAAVYASPVPIKCEQQARCGCRGLSECNHGWDTAWYDAAWVFADDEQGGHKPKSRREDLVRAGALILAEIERLDRAEQHKREAR